MLVDTCMALSYPVTLVWMITVELCVTPLVAHVACVTSTLTPRSDRPYQGYVCTENIPQINRSKKRLDPTKLDSSCRRNGCMCALYRCGVVWPGLHCAVRNPPIWHHARSDGRKGCDLKARMVPDAYRKVNSACQRPHERGH